MPSVNNSTSAWEHEVLLVIESRLAAVPILLSMVEAVCATAGMSSADGALVSLCVVEAANNSIIHAYHEEAGKAVSVAVKFSGEMISFEIFDSGMAADFRAMNADHRTALETVDAGLPPESGRGIAIMQEVMDSVEYTSSPERNCLRLVKSFRRRGV